MPAPISSKVARGFSRFRVVLAFLVIPIAGLTFFLIVSPRSSAPGDTQDSKRESGTATAFWTDRRHPAEAATAGHTPVGAGADPRSQATNFGGAITNAMTLENFEGRDLVFSQLDAWMEVSPSDAAKFVESLPRDEWRAECLRRVAQLWTQRDPGQAESWAMSLKDENERLGAFADICYQVSSHDARRAMKLAEIHDLGKMPGGVMVNLLQQWAEQDFPEAIVWAQRVKPGSYRDDLFNRLVVIRACSNPFEAANLIVTEMSPGPLQDEAAIAVLHRWAAQDFDAASAWVRDYPAGDLRERADKELCGMAARSNSARSTVKKEGQ